MAEKITVKKIIAGVDDKGIDIVSFDITRETTTTTKTVASVNTTEEKLLAELAELRAQKLANSKEWDAKIATKQAEINRLVIPDETVDLTPIAEPIIKPI